MAGQYTIMAGQDTIMAGQYTIMAGQYTKVLTPRNFNLSCKTKTKFIL